VNGSVGVDTYRRYPGRDGGKPDVAKRGSRRIRGPKRGEVSASVIGAATRKVGVAWPIRGDCRRVQDAAAMTVVPPM